MDLGLLVPTQGVFVRRANGIERVSVAPSDIQLAVVAKTAESLGFACLAFPDHVVTGLATTAAPDGDPVYPAWPADCTMLDPLTAMAFAAGATSSIELWTSILVAPLRHPLVVAHQLATIDSISGGRVSAGIAAGWYREEFEALDQSFADRASVTEECLQIYDLTWREEHITFHGQHFQFDNVTVLPKPVQRPRIPLLHGGESLAAARRAARYCNALYPRVDETATDPASCHDPLREAVKTEAAATGRALDGFRLLTLGSLELDPPAGVDAPFLGGSPDEILSHLERMSDHGFSHCTIRPVLRDASIAEFLELAQRIAEEISPEATRMRAAAL